jgi:DNA repair protein RadA/Sms
VFVCSACRLLTARYSYTCPVCHTRGTLQVTTVPVGDRDDAGPADVVEVPIRALDRVGAEAEPERRYRSGLRAWDRALGGGQLPGTVTLLGGDPGLGKSTLALQVLAGLQRRGATRALYISCEEPVERVYQRARRIGVPMSRLYAGSEQVLPAIEAAIRRWAPHAVVIDSIQSVYDPDAPGIPGSVAQVKLACWRFVRLARELHAAVLVLCHVDKAGEFAGPQTLQHEVDVLVMLEGDPSEPARTLRVQKNRFGATTETGRLAMREDGLR